LMYSKRLLNNKATLLLGDMPINSIWLSSRLELASNSENEMLSVWYVVIAGLFGYFFTMELNRKARCITRNIF